jgi:serine/threonine-protein kinase
MAPAPVPPLDDSRSPTLDSTKGPTRVPPMMLGTVVASYRLEREIGRGAAGVVFAARHVRTNAPIALKVLPRGGRSTAERFDREVQALAKLQHPNVVGIHEAGDSGTFRWYAMDFVDGLPLDRWLARGRSGVGVSPALAPASETPVPPARLDDAIKALLQVARGMEHAHGRGLVHRDLKPSNVLVTAEGVARVSDFGVAKHLDRATRLTEQGAMLGTLQYMAPEQCADSARIDGRADVWAIGVMLFEAATGSLPFDGDSVITIVTRICSDPLPRPRTLVPTISADLEAVIVRTLEKEPDARYPTMSALAADLERLLKKEPVSASRVTLRRALLRRFGLLPLLLGVSVVGGLGATAAWFTVHYRRTLSEAAASDARRALRERADEIERSSARALERARSVARPSEARAIAVHELEARAAELARFPTGADDRAGAEETLVARRKLEASPLRRALLVAVGRATLLEGDVLGARALLERALPGGGDEDAELLLWLGSARLACGDEKGAEDALVRAEKLAPDRWEPALRLAEARARTGGADDLFAARSRHAPDPEITAVRAEQLVAAGRAADALTLLGPALRSESRSSALHVARARALIATDREAKAFEELGGVEDGLALREEVRLHLACGATADALLALERLVKLAPDSASLVVEHALLLGARGDLDAAALELGTVEGRLAGTPGEWARADRARVLAALLPLEVALGRRPDGVLTKLETVAPVEAALGRARLSATPEEKPLEEALEKLGASSSEVIGGAGVSPARPGGGRATSDPSSILRTELLAELARAELGTPARARARLDEALALDPRSRAARLVMASLLGGAGSLAEARAAREAALAIGDDPASVACAEGRASACIALDAMRPLRQRFAEESRRRGMARYDAADGSPSTELLEKAARSLRLAAALDPALSPARALLGRVELALGRAEAARTCASEALERDPLSLEAATLFAQVSRPDDVDAVLARTARALDAEPDPASAPLRDALARLLERAGLAPRAALLEREAATLGGDRELLAHVALLLESTGDPQADLVRKQLAELDRAADEARASVKRADEAANANRRDDCIALVRRAIESQPDDVEVLDVGAADIRKIWRTFSDTSTGIASYEADTDPVVHTARYAFADGRRSVEGVRHVFGLRTIFGAELVDDWRRKVDAVPDERERLSMRLSISLVAATWDLFTPDTGTQFLAGRPHVPLAEVHRNLAELARSRPECPTVYALRAVHFARSRQTASMEADMDRFLHHHPSTVNDLWLASALEVVVGDTAKAAELALLGIRVPGANDTDRRMFIEDNPFPTVRDAAVWAPVVAAAKR